MRKTLRIDNDLHRELKERAKVEKVSLTRMFNDVIRRGLEIDEEQTKEERPFHQQTHDMGEPIVDISKALKLAGQLEVEETLKRLTQHK